MYFTVGFARPPSPRIFRAASAPPLLAKFLVWGGAFGLELDVLMIHDVAGAYLLLHGHSLFHLGFSEGALVEAVLRPRVRIGTVFATFWPQCLAKTEFGGERLRSWAHTFHLNDA